MLIGVHGEPRIQWCCLRLGFGLSFRFDLVLAVDFGFVGMAEHAPIAVFAIPFQEESTRDLGSVPVARCITASGASTTTLVAVFAVTFTATFTTIALWGDRSASRLDHFALLIITHNDMLVTASVGRESASAMVVEPARTLVVCIVTPGTEGLLKPTPTLQDCPS